MIRSFSQVSKRAVFGAAVIGAVTVSAAGAATFHRLTVSQAAGSGGATTFLQNSASSSALQGEVASSARTSIAIPFGVLGEYDAAGSTFGIGVAGISTTGYGIAGEALGSQPSVIGVSGGTNVGVFAAASSATSGSPFEAEADNSSNAGTFNANTGDAIDAEARGTGTGQGVYTSNDSAEASALAANNNQSAAPTELDAGGGVYGSAQGPGLYAESYADPGVTSVFDCNVYQDSDGTDGGLGGQTCAGLYVVQTSTSGWPLLVYNSSTSTYPLYLDSTGNLHITGNLVSASSVSRLPGSDAMTYAPKQTEATLEDLGTAQLVNGISNVPLRADFRSTINASAPYMVFLTPHGDNRGLFVASSGPQGFTIRESQGGRSTLAFDYRIVARPIGAVSPRLPRDSANGPSVPRADHVSPMRYAGVRARMQHRQTSHSAAAPRMFVPSLISTGFRR